MPLIKNLVESIKLGLYDNYELLRRLSALTASMNGSPLLIDDIFAMRQNPVYQKELNSISNRQQGCMKLKKQ
jgi:hypothetical protein